MTKNRLAYLASLVVTFALAYYRAGFISTMLFYMVILLPIAEGLMVMITSATFRLSHDIDKKKVNKGETIHYAIELANNTPLLYVPLTVNYTGSDLLFKGNTFDRDPRILYPFKDDSIHQTLECRYRGTYHIGLDSITIRGFFGLFERNFKSIETHHITVYPQIHEFKRTSIRQSISESSESILSFDKQNKSNFSEVRPYIAGDNLSKIHWKLSAKKDEWMTKEYEGNVNHHVKLFVNNHLMALENSLNIIIQDHLIESVVALSKHFLDNSISSEMIWHQNQNKHLKGATPHEFGPFFDTLANMTFENTNDKIASMLLKETSDRGDKAMIVFFTATLTAELTETLKRCARDGYEVNVLISKLPAKILEHMKDPVDKQLLYSLLDVGVHLYHPIFEDNICRLEAV
jgi:hypothetical protein